MGLQSSFTLKFQSWRPMLTKTCDVGTAVFDFTVSFNCSSCASNCFIIISTSWAQVIISDCEDNIICMNILLHRYVCLKPHLVPTSPEGELGEGKDSALWGILNTKNSANIWTGPQKRLMDRWALWSTMDIIFLKCTQVLSDIPHSCISKQRILRHVSPTINIHKYKTRIVQMREARHRQAGKLPKFTQQVRGRITAPQRATWAPGSHPELWPETAVWSLISTSSVQELQSPEEKKSCIWVLRYL